MRPNYFDFERYVLPYDRCSPCEQVAEFVCAIPGIVSNWGRRARARRELGRLDPRMLRDIGVTPSEAARECDKPFWRV